MTSNPGNFGLPDRNTPIGVGRDNKGAPIPIVINDIWQRFLVRLAQLTAERPIQNLDAGNSPFEYAATTIGDLLVRDGVVGGVTLTRGDITITCPTSGFVPMAAEDVVTVTFSSKPSVLFVPRARA